MVPLCGRATADAGGGGFETRRGPGCYSDC